MVERKENGSLTGSKRYKKEADKKGSTLKSATEKVVNSAKTTSKAVGTVSNSIGNVTGAIGVQGANISNRVKTAQNEYGGLNLPLFDPQNYLAADLFSDSSSLNETTKAEADAMVDSIEEKRQTLRVVGANLDLNTDVIKAGVKSEKMVQAAVDYGIAKVNTDTKLVQFDTVNVQYDIAVSKLHQIGEKLVHENITLEGLRNETEQRRRFWGEKYNLGESRIKQVQLAKYQLDAKIGAIETEAESIE